MAELRMTNNQDDWMSLALKREAAISELQAESERRGAENARLSEFVLWVDTWVSNPASAYSTSALEGIFMTTRDRIASLRRGQQQDVGETDGIHKD